MNVKDSKELPNEILEWFDRYNKQAIWWHSLSENGNPALTIDPLQVHYYRKSDTPRVVAWLKCLKIQGFKDKNPWRKYHTEHYWCWVLSQMK